LKSHFFFNYILETIQTRLYKQGNIQWATKVVETLLGMTLFNIQALGLFYLHLALIL